MLCLARVSPIESHNVPRLEQRLPVRIWVDVSTMNDAPQPSISILRRNQTARLHRERCSCRSGECPCKIVAACWGVDPAKLRAERTSGSHDVAAINDLWSGIGIDPRNYLDPDLAPSGITWGWTSPGVHLH